MIAASVWQLKGSKGFDFAVYRGSLESLFSGHGLYSFEVVGRSQEFSFTYPPFAALLMSPFALSSLKVARLVWVIVQYALVALLAVLVFRQSPAVRYPRWEGLVLLGVTFCGIALSQPVVEGVRLGQISLLLVTLVLVDFLMLPPKWRGALVGVAAAVKLLPLIFLPYFVITRQWRALVTSVVAAASATAVAFVVLPQDSALYWTNLVFQTGRVGDPRVWNNKSLLGFLMHWGIGTGVQNLVWIALVVVIAVVAYWRAWRHYHRGEELAAVLVVGLLSTVVSPITWVHHLAWIPVAGAYLLLLGRRRWSIIVGALVLLAMLHGTPLVTYFTGDLIRNAFGDVIVLIPIVFCLFGFPHVRSPDPADPTQVVRLEPVQT